MLGAHQGRELAMLEPNSLVNHGLAVSADGRFVAVASFTAEVKIWEVKYAKDTGDFKGETRGWCGGAACRVSVTVGGTSWVS